MNEVKDSVEFYRNLWAGAEARLADCESSLVQSQAEVARLREAISSAAVRAQGFAYQVPSNHYMDAMRVVDTLTDALEPTR